MLAVFSLNMQLLNTGKEKEELHTPPPPPLTALFPLNVQLLTVGEELVLYIPPPEIADPLVITNPSMTVSLPSPESQVITLPTALPSMIVDVTIAAFVGSVLRSVIALPSMLRFSTYVPGETMIMSPFVDAVIAVWINSPELTVVVTAETVEAKANSVNKMMNFFIPTLLRTSLPRKLPNSTDEFDSCLSEMAHFPLSCGEIEEEATFSHQIL